MARLTVGLALFKQIAIRRYRSAIINTSPVVRTKCQLVWKLSSRGAKRASISKRSLG